MASADKDFAITFDNFGDGFSPLAHIDTKTFKGSKGQASEMKADVISNPIFLQQSPALVDLTNGNQAGSVTELIRYILDRPVASNVTFGIGMTKLFKISATAVINSGWPRTITGMTEGESVIRMKNNLFAFYNKTTGGDIAVLPLNELYMIRNPQTAANDDAVGTVAWSTPNNALASDNSYVTADLSGDVVSNYLKLTNFGFTLPTDAVIKGVIVSIERFATNGDDESIKDGTIKLVKGGTVSGDNKAVADDWTETEGYHEYGSVSDLWGLTLTASDINASNFGVVISAEAGSTDDGGVASIDHVKITVYYTSATEDGELIPAWGSTNDQLLEKALHPSAAKEDILLFGNGRYVGAFIEGSSLLDVQKLDFGEGAEVADIVFHSNLWWIAVNYGEGRRGQIYVYDGSAMSNVLSDEVGVGSQKIGFLYVLNGIVYVAYDDLTAEGFAIGRISGRQLKPLRYFSGSLPDHRQKTLYKNTILFISDEDIYSVGAPIEQLPVQISKLADAGYDTVGAIAAPFGIPMIASTEIVGEVINYRLAKFSGLSVDSYWKSVFVDITRKLELGKITAIIVETKALEEGAYADLFLEGNQGKISSSAFKITGEDKTRHKFTSIDLAACEDIRAIISYASGSATVQCPIRKITVVGNFVEM